MRLAKYVFGAALAGAALLAAEGAMATVVAQDLSGTSLSARGYTWWESFVTPSGSSFRDVTINFYAASGQPFAAGTGYLVAAPHIGGPSGPTRAGALAASVSSAGGVWAFDPALELASGKRYYFYEDAALPSLIGHAGGVLGDGGFSDSAPNNVNYTVRGFTVPEPASWGLLLAGLGLTGLALRRRILPAS